ncbi:dTDP-4-dehydrorhamnose 3,5-epimerase [Leptolinea tardivitalis]|uniref:dTDP-4-dehydrorhamnose 3,5-epimerase n=1 Tax=Leptolinea tardivitalis TaxID=229920 RepID=A0A0P6WW36_9CHLR|nr:dTDP-4-dehydrorhamnose 3,5-epimerase [Leptolinea tardivitalis]KPL70206.1 dTDP-4-dehydrorhamnose 3,5-epimerase [Leptolinea tardivitalis]GAP21741.1 dTDP-4-dehydrorhamnose 3,5-epimerase [Leptolinea tardivitalis]
MLFQKTEFDGLFIIEPEKHTDERGFFARTWCVHEFADHGLVSDLAQCSISFNARKGTLRGMHYQVEPYPETKVVRCTMGAIFDVVIDLRPGSTTYRKWFSVELSAENRRALYIPDGMAHGFQTLEDNSEVYYMISEFYHPECARGIRWNDPAIGIEWPIEGKTISERDATFPVLP